MEATGTHPSSPPLLPGAQGPSCRLWLRLGPQVKFGPKPPRVRALARDNSNPSLWPRPSDIYIVSYPKSGQTWIRFLLANLIRYEEAAARREPRPLPIDFDTVESRIPFLEDVSLALPGLAPSPAVCGGS